MLLRHDLSYTSSHDKSKLWVTCPQCDITLVWDSAPPVDWWLEKMTAKRAHPSEWPRYMGK